MKPFYSDAGGAKLTALLRDHILIAAALVAAAKAGDTAKVAAARTRWYANADEIAGLLSSANPRHWPQGEMRAMLREHLDLTLVEATVRLKADWALGRAVILGSPPCPSRITAQTAGCIARASGDGFFARRIQGRVPPGGSSSLRLRSLGCRS